MTSYHYFGNEGEKIPEDVTELVIHPLVHRIPRDACLSYKHLTSVNFNGSALKIIGKYTFLHCQALEEIEIPPSVMVIEEGAFRRCYSLTTVRFHQDGVLTTIGIGAFAYCTSLTDISIPSSVESIQYDAFSECKCLTRVAFQEGLKFIGDVAFAACKELETMAIPRTLELLGEYAFSGCESLQEVTIEEGNLRAIEKRAFESCVKLRTISIPSTVERIESGAFSFCDSLEILKFRSGLNYVGYNAFESCKNLQAVELPESVETIGSDAFAECRRLVSVGWEDHHSTVTIHDNAFSKCKSLVNICLPSECRIRRPVPGRFDPTPGDNIFQGCEALEKQYGSMMTEYNLMHRFDNFPIHKKCYQASVTTTDELAREIESSTQSSQENTGDRLVDPFGMTPFHVLLSGASCTIDLLQVLLDAYPSAVLRLKDVNGKTAIEYSTQRKFLDEESRTMLQMTLKGWLVGSISSWKALDVWKSDMSSRVIAIVAENEVEQRQSLLEEATMVLSRYERIEATTLLELSLWKAKLEYTYESAEDAARAIVDRDDRGAYRICSGASVVIPNVIALL